MLILKKWKMLKMKQATVEDLAAAWDLSKLKEKCL